MSCYNITSLVSMIHVIPMSCYNITSLVSMIHCNSYVLLQYYKFGVHDICNSYVLLQYYKFGVHVTCKSYIQTKHLINLCCTLSAFWWNICLLFNSLHAGQFVCNKLLSQMNCNTCTWDFFFLIFAELESNYQTLWIQTVCTAYHLGGLIHR